MGKLFAILMAFAFLIAFGLTIGGWTLMLAVGMLHHWDASVPTMGFWTSVPIAICLGTCLGGARSGSAS